MGESTIDMASTPLYREIQDRIVESLVSNEWRPGDILPSEKNLAKHFSVATSTVRRALSELVDARVLVRIQGKGTFVAHHNDSGSRYRFFNVVNAEGSKEPLQRTLISVKVEKAKAEALRLFDIPMAATRPEVYRIRFKLGCKDENFAVAEVILPRHLCSNLELEVSVDGEESLYALYQAAFGINIVRVVEHMFAVKAPVMVARALGIEVDEPLLEIRRTAFTFHSVPVEQRTTWIHTRHHHYLLSQGA